MKRDKRVGVRKNSYGYWRLVCGLLIALTIMTVPVGQVMADSPLLFPDQQVLYGTRMSEWSAQWWQFVMSFPKSESPLSDESGDRCTIGQRGPVWFLMGTSGGTATRNCTIPDGKALFFPLLNLADIGDATYTVRQLREELDPCMDNVTQLSLMIDGKEVVNFDKRNKFRVKSVAFDLYTPPYTYIDPKTDKSVTVDAANYSPVVDDGYYVMLKPLSTGLHTLQFSGTRTGCILTNGEGFSLNVTYHINVVPVLLK
jgi:hypothetical protein